MQLSESFYSIQGEGVSTGVPAYFVRLFNCNLMCGGPQGSLVEAGKATWWCDTEDVWKRQTEFSNEEFEEKIRKEGEELGFDLIEGLISGVVHFIWTGGEPTMEHNREAISLFLLYWDKKYPDNKSFHEIETNGTIVCPWDHDLHSIDKFKFSSKIVTLYDVMDQINCSAKLANSGMKAAVRIVPDAINQIKVHPNHWWKFVVDCTSEETALQDMEEITRDYIEPFDLDRRRIILMPGVDKLEDLPDVTRVLYEVSKKLGVRASTRAHILAWDQTTGV